MADNIVTIQVRIDDKGNLSAVGNKADAAAGKMDKASKSAGTLGRNMKGAGEASSGAGKNFSKMSQGMGGFVGAYATLAANVFAVSAAFNFLKRAADVEQLRKSQVEFANSTGTALQSVTMRLREASGGMLGFQEAAQAAAIGSAKGFSPQQLEELAIGAGKVSKALGRDFTDSFDRLVRGVSKAEPELLDELGITLRLEEATKSYAKALGVNAKELTTYQRSQAVLAETQRQLNEQFGDFDGNQNAFVKLQKTFEDVVNLVAEKVLPVFEFFANIIANNIGIAIGVFALIGAKIFGTIPAVAGLGESLDEFVSNAEQGITSATEDMDEYSESIANAKKELQDQADLADNAFKGAQKGAQNVAKDLDARKGSGLEALQKGEEPSKRQLAGMLKAARDNKGEYAKLDTDRRVFFIKQLEKMQKASKETSRSFVVHAKRAGLGMKSLGLSINKFVILSLKKTSLRAKKVFAGIAKGAIGAGKAIGKVFKVAAIGTALFGALDAIDNILKFPITFLRTTIDVVVKLGSIFQTLINGILTGFNLVANKVRSILGKEEQEAFQLDLIPEDATNKLMEYLETLPVVGEALDKLQKTEDKNTALAKQQASLENLGEAAKTVAADLAAVNEGLVGQGASAESSMKRMTAIGTAGISGLVRKALKDATTGEGDDAVVDPEAAKAGMKAIIDKLGDEAKTLSPRLRAALGLPIEEAVKEIRLMEDQALAFTSNTKQFTDEIKAVQEQLGTGNFEAALELIKPLDNTKNKLIELADETNEVTEAQKTLDDAFAFAGGIEAYKTTLKELIAEEKRLKEQRQQIDIQTANTALLTSGQAQRAKERLDITKAQNAVDENALDIRRKRKLLEEAEAGQGEFADNVGKKESLAKEIEDQERLGETLENNVRIAQAKGDDIKKLGLTIGNSLESNLAGAFEALAMGTKSFKEAFADMAKAILADIAKMIAKALVLRMLTSAFGGSSFGTFLGIAPPAKTGGILEPPQYRNGGIARNMDYSTGGVARGSQAGYPAILHGTEAVVPLPDGRNIPVEMRGGMGTQNNVTVNVTVDNSGGSQQSSQSDSPMGENLGRLVASAVQDELHFQKRSGGILNPYGVV
tara:strand:- start:2866 stop:6171 length:3306 start_codon:yes stop_codon:yes gene_type:complete